MRGTLLVVGILVAGLQLGSIAAHAAPVVACVIDEPPWGRKSGNTGIYPEVIERLVEATGLEIRQEITPLPRVLHDLHSDHCQFTITSWTETRADRVVRGAIFAELDYGLLVASRSRIDGPTGLAGKTIAWTRGLLIGEPYDSDRSFEKYLVDGYDQAMMMTEAGRVDAAVGSLVTLEALARARNTTAAFGQRIVLTKAPLVLQFSPSFSSTPGAARLNDAVWALHDSGAATEIITRHFARMGSGT